MECLQFEDPTKALVQGVQEGDLQLVEKILQQKDKVNLEVLTPCKDGISRTLMGLVAHLGHDYLVAPLAAAGVDVNGKGSRAFSPLIHASRVKHVGVIRELVKVNADINATTTSREVRNSVLHTCSMMGVEEGVAILLAQPGINVSPQDDLGYTPLHVASRINHIPIMNRLVEAGAKLDLLTIYGWTPLHVASMAGSLDAVKRLLELKFDIYAKDKEGRTPCDLADEMGMTNVYWFFIKKAGQIEKTVLTPPHKSEKRYDIERFLLDWAENGGDEVLPMLKLNQPDPFDGYYQDAAGYTTLHITAERGHHKATRVLIEECFIYPLVYDRKERTPAELARANGHFQLAEFIESHIPQPKDHHEAEALYYELLEVIGQGDDIIRASQLLFKGAPIEPIGQHSTHAVILAITANRRRILTLLIAAGAPLTIMFQGLNILQIAWISPHISTYIRMIVTRVIVYALKEELSRVDPNKKELSAGIRVLLRNVGSDTPWIARWPEPGGSISLSYMLEKVDCSGEIDTVPFVSPQTTSEHLTHLMTQAVQVNCSLTTAFIQQAGGIPFAIDAESGSSPFIVALESKHWSIARQIAKGTSCMYIPDRCGNFPRDMLPDNYRKEFESEIFDRESRKIDNEREKAKDEEIKVELARIYELQRELFEVYRQDDKPNGTVDINVDLGKQTLLLASQLGLSQLVHLLLKVGQIDVNSKLEPLMGTTALHQAAAFGHSDISMLLLSRGANIGQRDHFQHTPPHFAAMFGHESAYNQLALHMEDKELINLTNNTPSSVRANFYSLLKQYNVLDDFLQQSDNFYTCNDPAEAEKIKLDKMSLLNVVQQSLSLCVNFTVDEAAEVKAIILEELEQIKNKIGQLNPIFTGHLELLGSAADNTRLHAPDEFDFNFCIDMAEKVKVRVIQMEREGALLKGHPKDLRVTSKDDEIKSLLRDSNWKDGFYRAAVECLKTHSFSDNRLNLVPPGVTRTQVGVGLALVWQGIRYPLLLIGIDLVPVMRVCWPENVERPYLTPKETSHVYISSIGSGQWRLSFANLEAGILKSLQPEERKVYLTCKTLLSCMKAEPWMPKAIKNKFTWWNSRRWKIPIPSGFALKNCFLRRLEEKKQSKTVWKEKDLARHMLDIFNLMVEEEFYEVTGITGLVSKKIYPYFGGEFEKPKLGEGSLEIIRYVKKHCKE